MPPIRHHLHILLQIYFNLNVTTTRCNFIYSGINAKYLKLVKSLYLVILTVNRLEPVPQMGYNNPFLDKLAKMGYKFEVQGVMVFDCEVFYINPHL